jgi:hypothetical protein
LTGATVAPINGGLPASELFATLPLALLAPLDA